MIKILALFVTLTAAAMTAVAAWDRGGTQIDKALLVSMSIVIVLAVHLLPAISRRPTAWLVWGGCLICAVYGHLTFLTHAGMRANDNLAQHSALVVGTERQIQLAQESLARIKARPVADVAAELAKASDKRVRAALTVEIAQGKKAEELRDELVRLSGVSTEAQVSGAADPVTARIALATGWTESGIAVAIGLTFSMILELIGALVWVEALRPSTQKERVVTQAFDLATEPVIPATQAKTTGATQPVTPATPGRSTHVTQDATTQNSNATTGTTTDATTPATHDATTAQSNEATPATTAVTLEESIGATQHVSSGKTDQEDELLITLKSAIQSGKCKATVNGIREFLECSQNRAVELRRAVTA